MEVKIEKIDHRDIFYPPGGLLLWIIILLELFTFGLGLFGFVYYGRLEPVLFQNSRIQLNIGLGTANTVVLLVSGYMMASAVDFYRKGYKRKTYQYLKWTLIGGGIFIGIKTFEYYEKLSSGIDMDDNMFFTFYWLITGFHLVHVLVGMVILGWMLYKMRAVNSAISVGDLESGAAFWHMCDLVWLILFPSLYLIF